MTALNKCASSLASRLHRTERLDNEVVTQDRTTHTTTSSYALQTWCSWRSRRDKGLKYLRLGGPLRQRGRVTRRGLIGYWLIDWWSEPSPGASQAYISVQGINWCIRESRGFCSLQSEVYIGELEEWGQLKIGQSTAGIETIFGIPERPKHPEPPDDQMK